MTATSSHATESPKAPLVQRARARLGLIKEATCYDSAIVALSHIQEWAKWMAGIQVAAIGGLGAVVAKAGSAQPSGNAAWPLLGDSREWAMAAFVLLALALFFSAWVLSALGSIALRIGLHASSPTTVSEALDIYYIRSFTWWGGRLSLGTLMALQHWAWAIGLCCLGVFVFKYFA